MRPFLPSLLGSHQLDSVEEDEETETSTETSPSPGSLVGAGHDLDSSSAEDFDISGLWDEEDSDGAVEQVKQILCIIYFLKKFYLRVSFNLDFINALIL